jgi:dihydrolipoamide dehydrogenase
VSEIDVELAIIGGGPAGIAAAREAGKRGLSVLLVDASEALGGRAAHATSIPLRLLSSAGDWRPEFVAERARAFADRARLGLEDAGVAIVRGRARFVDPHHLETDAGDRVHFDHALIATGARARSLEGAPADQSKIFAADELRALHAMPREAIVIGGGAAGAEITDALSRRGVRTTWIMDELGILPSFDRELAEALGDVLMERGVKLVHGKAAQKLALGQSGVEVKLDGGRTYAAEIAIVAIGNAPALEGLELARAGLDARAKIAVDAQCRTKVAHLFAAGDVCGESNIAAAEVMGRIAARAAAGDDDARYDAALVPRAVYAQPELAQVGITAEHAAGRRVVLHTLRQEETLAGLLDHIGERADKKGFVRAVCDSNDGRLLGASALGPHAREIANAAAIALSLGATEETLGRASAAIPSWLDALSRAAR